MKGLSRFATTALVFSLLAVVIIPQMCGATQISRVESLSSLAAGDIKYQSLGFSKKFFLYTMQQEIEWGNGLLRTNVRLGDEEEYYPLEGKDGWVWTLSNRMCLVAVAGPENDVEEAYYLAKNAVGNDTMLWENIVVLLAFEKVIYPEDQKRNEAHDWIVQQTSNRVAASDKLIGNRFLHWVWLEQDGFRTFGLRVFGEPKPLLTWWEILGIISAIVGISAAGYGIVIHFYRKRRILPAQED